MGVLDSMKSFIKAKSPEAELKEIRSKITAGVAEIAQLDAEIERRALPVLRGDAEAARLAAELRTTRREIEERLVTLRQAEGHCLATINAEIAATARAEAVARPRRQAELAADFLAADRELRMLFEDAGEKLRAQMRRADSLKTEMGDHVGRAFNPIAWMSRFRSQLAHHFAGNFAEGVPHTPLNNLLGLTSDAIGAAYFTEIDQLDQQLLDDLCPLYLTEAAASAAQARIAERNATARAAAREAAARRPIGTGMSDSAPPAAGAMDTIIGRAGDCFTLISHSALFSTHTEAQAAMGTNSVWRAGGYVVVGWQDGAAIIREELAQIIAPIPAPAARAA